MKRIKRGIDKFIVNNPSPVMVPDKSKAAFLISYYTEQSDKEVRGLSLDRPLHTITAGGNRFGLVTVSFYKQGVDQEIADIGLRMLQPIELFAGQGFPPGYTFNIGNKSDQIRRVGNSVPPQLAEHLVRANLPEMCVPKHMNKYSKAN